MLRGFCQWQIYSLWGIHVIKIIVNSFALNTANIFHYQQSAGYQISF